MSNLLEIKQRWGHLIFDESILSRISETLTKFGKPLDPHAYVTTRTTIEAGQVSTSRGGERWQSMTMELRLPGHAGAADPPARAVVTVRTGFGRAEIETDLSARDARWCHGLADALARVVVHANRPLVTSFAASPVVELLVMVVLVGGFLGAAIYLEPLLRSPTSQILTGCSLSVVTLGGAWLRARRPTAFRRLRAKWCGNLPRTCAIQRLSIAFLVSLSSSIVSTWLVQC